MPQVTSSRRMDLPSAVRLSSSAASPTSGSEIYTPKLKKVLKSCRAAATTSLMGPTSYQSSWSSPSPPSSSAKSGSSSTTSSCSSSSQQQQQPATKVPLIVPADESRCDWTETLLNGEVISCFVIGGEMRLCLPQVLNSVLKNSIEEINSACTELQIFCSRCTPDQLAILKRKNILPLEATSCGLITKTDAERLVAVLVDRDPPKLSDLRPKADHAIDNMLSVAVFHDCFGKTRGLYRPDLYATPASPCIQCCQCSALFPPQKFVAHSHQSRTSSRTCLWGFDSLNWRCYLLLAQDQSPANNCASRSAKSQVTGCCAQHRPSDRKLKDGQEQDELDRLMDQMRKRFDLQHHMSRQQYDMAAAAVNAKLNSVTSVSPPPPAKRKEKEVSESASRDEQPAKRLKPVDELPSSVPSFLPPHPMFYPNLLPIWSAYPSALSHHSLPDHLASGSHLFQLSYNQSAVPPISRHDQQTQLQSDSESQRDQVHRTLHQLTTLLVTLPQSELDEVCSSLRLTLDRIQGPQKEVRRHSAASVQQRVTQYR